MTLASETSRERAQRAANVGDHLIPAQGPRASAELSASLQAVLVELVELHLQGKQAHWMVIGLNFRDTHLALDEIVESARGYADDVAERMRALKAFPDGRSDTVVRTTVLPGMPEGEISVTDTVSMISDRLYRVSDVIRKVHDEVDAEDPTSSDLLHDILTTVEKQAWMLSSENR